MGFRDVGVSFIDTNPVIAAKDRREKIISDQQDADLTRAVNEASYFRTVGLAPLEKRKMESDANLADINAYIAGETKGDKVGQSHDEATSAHAKSQYDVGAYPLKLEGDRYDNQIRGSQAKVQIGTENDQMTTSHNNAAYSGLRNTQIAGEIGHQQDSWRHEKETWNLDRPGAIADSLTDQDRADEALLRLAATRGIDAAVKAANDHNYPIDQDIVQFFKDPKFSVPAAQIYAALEAKAPGDTKEEVGWRATQFFKASKALASGKSINDVMSSIGDGPGTIDPLWKNAMEQAGKELNEQFFATPEERSAAINSRANELYRSLKSGPGASAPPPAAPEKKPWWQFGSDDASGVAALAGAQPLPQLPNNAGLDRSKLVKGAIYNMEGVGRVKFNGQAFEAVGQ